MVWVRAGAVLGFLAVALGAFGAHGLKERLEALNQAANFQTATFYLLTHALAVLAVGLALPAGKAWWLNLAGGLFVAGALVFSGSLYILALTGLRWLGMVAPLGGLALLAGWLAFAVGAAGSSGRS